MEQHTKRLFWRTYTTQTRVLHTKRTYTLTFQLNQRVTKCRFCSYSNNSQLFRCGLKLILFSNVFSILHYSGHFCIESDKFLLVATTRRYTEQRGFIWAAPVPNSPSGPSSNTVGDQYGGQPCLCLFFIDHKALPSF